MKRRSFLKMAVAALAAPRLARAESERVLRFIPRSDLTALDPVWTSVYVTRNHGYLVFDTLYGQDSSFQVQPQMVEGAVTEQDGRVWRLKLCDGLLFHDDTPVLARDCVASIRRWAKRDAFGQTLMLATDELSAGDDRTILLRLEAPLPALARCARQDGHQYAADHARAAGEYRSLQAGDRDGGQRPVPLPPRGAARRRAGRLSALREISPARARRPRSGGRPQDRSFRQDRMERDPGRCDGRLRHAEGRGGLVGAAGLRSPAASGALARARDFDRRGDGQYRLAAHEPALPALRQSRDPARLSRRPRPSRVHGGRGRGRRQGLARSCRRLRAGYADGERGQPLGNHRATRRCEGEARNREGWLSR